VRETHDVLFAAPGGYPLRLDITQPREASGARPAVIVAHGGMWLQGDKSLYGFGLHNRWLAAQGYVVFDIQYRLAARWPAPLEDVKCAVRWVKTNAARYGADPAQIALLGRSVGGYLALMAAYTANLPDFPAGCFEKSEIDESVQAVIAAGAPTDLRLWIAEQGSAIEQLLVGLSHDVPAIYDDVTPATHVRPGLPPTLIIHGQRDRMVPPAHAEILANRLQAAGVPNVLLAVPWGRHGADAFLVGLTAPMILYDIDRFLAWTFYRHTE
jgi:acetyl esterase/lipase